MNDQMFWFSLNKGSINDTTVYLIIYYLTYTELFIIYFHTIKPNILMECLLHYFLGCQHSAVLVNCCYFQTVPLFYQDPQ